MVCIIWLAGARFGLKSTYLFWKWIVQMKLIPRDSTSTITTFWVTTIFIQIIHRLFCEWIAMACFEHVIIECFIILGNIEYVFTKWSTWWIQLWILWEHFKRTINYANECLFKMGLAKGATYLWRSHTFLIAWIVKWSKRGIGVYLGQKSWRLIHTNDFHI